MSAIKDDSPVSAARRNFLRGCAATAAIAAVPRTVLAADASVPAPIATRALE